MNTGGAGARKGHGKVILLGEHSVVYGRPAIAVGIARGCSAEAEFGSVDTLAVEPWGVQIEAGRPEADPEREQLRRAFAKICERYASPSSARRPLVVHARMEIPGGAGLGGSAALSVAVLRAMDARLGLDPGPDELLAASLAWEGVYHGNPSGIDSALAIRGGLALYRRGEPLAAIRVRRALCLVVANSGEHGSTKDMVESVARQHAREPIKTEQTFDAIEALVLNAKSALEDGDHASLGQLMDMNQALLNTLVLSTSKLEEICQTARKAGALGAKLTGGGGGGCAIAVAHDSEHAQPIVRALGDKGYDSFVVEVAP
jgi:mevalonate kinase